MPADPLEIADMIQPSMFARYTIERTAELSALYQSGIVVRDERLQESINNVSRTGNMPHFEDLTGDSEVLQSAQGLTTANIATDNDIFVAHYRGRAWGVEDLASLIIGNNNADPMDVIINRVGAWWARDRQKMTVQTLAGIFSATDTTMDANTHDVSVADQANTSETSEFNAKTFADAVQVLGDAAASCPDPDAFRCPGSSREEQRDRLCARFRWPDANPVLPGAPRDR